MQLCWEEKKKRVRLCWMGCYEEEGVVNDGGRAWQWK